VKWGLRLALESTCNYTISCPLKILALANRKKKLGCEIVAICNCNFSPSHTLIVSNKSEHVFHTFGKTRERQKSNPDIYRSPGMKKMDGNSPIDLPSGGRIHAYVITALQSGVFYTRLHVVLARKILASTVDFLS
jgi:hypothetical protein